MGKEYGRSADLIKYVVEHGEDPDLDELQDISKEDQKNKLWFFWWQEETKEFMDWQERLSSGKKMLYTLIWGQCTKNMQNELETTAHFKKMKHEQDPIALISSIKAIMFSFRDQKYIIGSMWHAYKNVFTTIQREDEETKTFYDRFKNVIEVIETYGGDIGGMSDVYKTYEEYMTPTKNREMILNISKKQKKGWKKHF